MQTYFRRNLPHLYSNYGIYFITFRLANSIPQVKLNELKEQIKNPENKENRIFVKYDKLLESENYDEKYLSNKEIADIVKYTLHYGDTKDYNLICYTIMPNHVHVVFELIQQNKGISKILQSIKRISSRKCNLYLSRSGIFWQDESFDRLIRDERELYLIIKYVLLNPKKCGLVNVWSDWPYYYCRKEYMVSEEDLNILL